MENFTFYSPTYFVFGKDEENNTGKYVKRFGGSKVLLHYGGGSVVRSGLLDRVKASLEKEGIAHTDLGGVMPNPRSGLVYEGIELCKKEGVDFVLAAIRLRSFGISFCWRLAVRQMIFHIRTFQISLRLFRCPDISLIWWAFAHPMMWYSWQTACAVKPH